MQLYFLRKFKMKKENILIVEKSEWTSLWNIHTCPLASISIRCFVSGLMSYVAIALYFQDLRADRCKMARTIPSIQFIKSYLP